jgi:hypothetical protein
LNVDDVAHSAKHLADIAFAKDKPLLKELRRHTYELIEAAPNLLWRNPSLLYVAIFHDFQVLIDIVKSVGGEFDYRTLSKRKEAALLELNEEFGCNFDLHRAAFTAVKQLFAGSITQKSIAKYMSRLPESAKSQILRNLPISGFVRRDWRLSSTLPPIKPLFRSQRPRVWRPHCPVTSTTLARNGAQTMTRTTIRKLARNATRMRMRNTRTERGCVGGQAATNDMCDHPMLP